MKKLLALAVGVLMLGTPIFARADDINKGRSLHAADLGMAAEDNALGLENPLDDNVTGRDRAKEIKVRKIFRFDSMVPISGALVGTDSIRGVPGGGAPWMLGSARGHLDETGKLEIDVRGLVLADSGINPAESFRGLVSCLGTDGTDAEPLLTSDFPADMDGNARISEMLTLPGGCLAPIVFVTGPEGQWFAVTGGMSSTAPVPEPAPDATATGAAAAAAPATVGTTAPGIATVGTTAPATAAVNMANTGIQGVIQ